MDDTKSFLAQFQEIRSKIEAIFEEFKFTKEEQLDFINMLEEDCVEA